MESLQAVIAKSCTPGAGVHDDWLAENIKTWPGLETIEGVAALYELWVATDDGNVRQACHKIEKELRVTRKEIVTYLLKRVENNEELTTLGRDLSLMIPYGEDQRVLRCYASYLGDRRVIMEGRPLASGYRIRVCDGAVNLLVLCFENAGILKWGEGGIVGDTLNQADFDQNIAAIRPYLVDAGIIEANAPYPPQPGRIRANGGVGTPTPSRERSRRVPTGADKTDDDTPGAWAWHWVAWLGIALAVVCLARLRLRPKTQDLKTQDKKI